MLIFEYVGSKIVEYEENTIIYPWQGPNGETPLGLAAKYSLKAVQMLVDKGAEVNASDDRGFTALRWAREKGQEEVVKFLLEKGAKE